MINYTFSLEDFEILLLVLVRISCFVHTAPFYGTTNVPRKVKIGFSAVVSLLIVGTVDASAVTYTGMIGYAVIVLREGITGLLIGLAANVCNSIILLSGNIIDMQMGLSMAQEYNILTKTQSTITGNLYQYFILLLLFASNMHHYILRALIDSYAVIPVNGQLFNWDSILSSWIQFMGDVFVIGLRIVLPVFISIMILNCVLGIMAKVAPQMHMFSIGVQLKVLLGLTVLYLTASLLPGISDMIFYEMKRMIVSMIKGMY